MQPIAQSFHIGELSVRKDTAVGSTPRLLPAVINIDIIPAVIGQAFVQQRLGRAFTFSSLTLSPQQFQLFHPLVALMQYHRLL